MAKFKKSDVGQQVARTDKDPLDSKKEVVDTIVAVPGMKEYDGKYPLKGPNGEDWSHNAKGVMLKDHPWEDEANWKIVK